QGEAHVHCTLPSPDNKYLLVADLGMDKIFTYDFNDKTGHLKPANPPYVEVTAGTGPRHLLFSKDAKYVYAIHELGDRITVFKNDHGKLAQEQTISMAPAGFEQRNWAAEIQFSPDGKFLYASNRDPLNDIVAYKVNPVNGKLTYLNCYSTGGKTLRYFMLSPDGKFLLVGQRNGNNILMYKRNAKTGLLTALQQKIPVADAVCMVMVDE
ncbi:MAG: lactonase family protein, partial [Chitinophagaceae bacterium]